MEPRAKGVSFRSSQHALAKLRGDDAVARTLDALAEPGLAAKLRAHEILPGGWYPLAWYRDLLGSMRRTTGEGPELMRALGREGVREDLGGVFRIFLLVVSPQFLLSRAAALWSTYYDTGKMIVEDKRPGGVTARAVGCTGFDENLWTGTAGGCEAALVAAGARDVKIEVVEGGRDGDDSMVFRGTWR
jgi:hypothetical protein